MQSLSPRGALRRSLVKRLVAGSVGVAVLLGTGSDVDALPKPPRSISATITKGQHDSKWPGRPLFESVTGTGMYWMVTFDASARYLTTDPANQADINKLFGFSDCGSFHQTNSARFGWVWNPATNQLELHSYTYANGVRSSSFLMNMTIGAPYALTIKVVGNTYQFMNGNTLLGTAARGCSTSTISGYALWPYFGGDETAPHDITITLSKATVAEVPQGPLPDWSTTI